MYKRPPLRVRDQPEKVLDRMSIPKNSFLYKIINPEPTERYKQLRQPVYQKDAYLKLLKKNNEECGIPWVEPDIPEYEEPVRAEKPKQPDLGRMDWVYLETRILKSGIIRIKLNTSFMSLYEKYYSENKKPPLKTILQAYKSRGFDDKFLERVKELHEKRLAHAKRVSKAIDLIFNKETTKKSKKKKEELKIVERDEEENNDEDEQDQEDNDRKKMKLLTLNLTRKLKNKIKKKFIFQMEVMISCVLWVVV